MKLIQTKPGPRQRRQKLLQIVHRMTRRRKLTTVQRVKSKNANKKRRRKNLTLRCFVMRNLIVDMNESLVRGSTSSTFLLQGDKSLLIAPSVDQGLRIRSGAFLV